MAERKRSLSPKWFTTNIFKSTFLIELCDLFSRNFQPVEPSVNYGAEDPNYNTNPYLQPNMNYTGSIYTPTVPVAQLDNQFNDFENEPPLLEGK